MNLILANPLVLRLVLGMFVNIVIKSIVKFDKGFDWAQLKAKIETEIRHITPWDIGDDELVAFSHWLVDKVDGLLDWTEAIKVVLEKVAAQDWPGAIRALKEWMLKELKLPVPSAVEGLSNGELDDALIGFFRSDKSA